MPTDKSVRLKILEDLDKHIVYSSNFEHYANSLLGLVCKNMRAETVFLAFRDPGRAMEPNPMIYGKRLQGQLEQNVARMVSDKELHYSGVQDGRVMTCKLSVQGSVLCLVGVVLAPKIRTSKLTRRDFQVLCESLKKDFYFVREQITQKKRLADLDTLYKISKEVSDTLDLDKLLLSIMDAAKKILKAHACSLAVADPVQRELTFTVAAGPSGNAILHQSMKFGQGIVGCVIDSGKPLLIADAQKDKRFFSGMDSRSGFITRSVLCVPMKLRNSIIGAIEVLNPRDRTAFSQEQIPLLATLAQEAAVSIENARLFQLATTDGLTGLDTIRYFKTLLAHEMSRAERYQRALSLIMMDIDFFKKVNDSYGHLAGDAILKALAAIIRQSIRTVDIAGRYGGEEFIVMLPEATRRDAVHVAERLRKKVQNMKVAHGKRRYSITISLGVTMLVKGDDVNSLVERADRQLYRAKQTGRNKVCWG